MRVRPDQRAIGERIKLRMTAVALDVPEFAERVSANENTVREWRRGYRIPASWRLPQICSELNCSADWLLGIEP